MVFLLIVQLFSPLSQVFAADTTAPTGVQASEMIPGNYRIQWTSVTGASNYKVYDITDGQQKLVATSSYNFTTIQGLAEGSYQFAVTAVKSGIESPLSEPINVNVVYPEIQAPTGFTISASNGNDLVLKWNSVTYANSYNVFKIDNGVKTLVKNVASTMFTITNSPEGQYYFEVTAVSDRYGESTTLSSASYDLVHPVMKEPANLRVAVRNGNDLVLNWDASTYATSYEVYQINDGQKSLVKTVTSQQHILPNLPEGTYNFEVYAVSDRFGKSASPSSVSHQLVFPQMQAPTNARANVSNTDDVGVLWDPALYATKHFVYQVKDGQDVLLGEATSRSFSVKDLPEGVHTFKIKSYSDRFGTSADAAVATAEIVYPEIATPVLSLQSFNGQKAKLVWGTIQAADYYNVYEMVNGEEVFVQKTTGNTIELDGLATGTHEYMVRAISNSFGESANSNKVSFDVIYDILAPTTTSDSTSPSWKKEDVTVTLTATDDKSGVAKTYYSFSNEEGAEWIEGNTFTISKEGSTTYYYYSVDNAGNKENVKNAMIRIDKTPPVTTSNAEEGWHDTFTLELTGEDDLSGLYTTFYSINGENFRVGDHISLTKKGEYNVSFYAMDKAGNKESVQTVQLLINGVEEPKEEETPLGNSGLQGEEVEELLDFIGNDPAKIEELEALEQNHPMPTWDPSQKNELLPQIEEFLNGLEDIAGVDVTIKTGENESVTIDELIEMEEINSDIVIEITTPDGEKIGEIVLPAETPVNEPIEEPVGEPAEDTPITNEPSEEPITTPTDNVDVVRDEEAPITLPENKETIKTVNGAELPQTASNMLLNILLGLGMMMVGGFVLLKNVRKIKGGLSK